MPKCGFNKVAKQSFNKVAPFFKNTSGWFWFVLEMFLNGSRFFREKTEIVCLAFKTFRGGFILQEFEMTSFLSIIFKLFFGRGRSFNFLNLQGMFSERFFFPFLKI